MQTRHQSLVVVFSTLMAILANVSLSSAQEPAFAGIFGSRNLRIENPNAPGTFYEMFLHNADNPSVYDELEYTPERGAGFIVLNPGIDTDDRFGPFDNSPNNRNEFDPVDNLYNSFIGFKDFATTCNENLIGDRTSPCATEIDPDGGIFRVDVPNGDYRFVAVMGDADNPHADRLLAENGGTGDLTDISDDYVTLIGNHDQAQWMQGTAEADRFGTGVFARVGFDNKLPPEPEGDPEGSLPAFVDYDENGDPLTSCTSPIDPDDEFEFLWKDETVIRYDGAEYSVPDVTCTTSPPNSPTLTVTEGYIRFHILQGNSNDAAEIESGDGLFFSPEGTQINLNRDPNGGDMVLLEVWPVGEGVAEGDYNADGELNALDIDLQAAEMKKPVAEQDLAKFDHNGDGVVDLGLAGPDESKWGDRLIWIRNLRGTSVGDVNFDNVFDSGDLVLALGGAKYGSGEMATWEQGDWSGDMVFDSGDLVLAFQDGQYVAAAGPAAVPEPSSLVLALFGVMGLAGIVRRRNG